MLDVKKMEAAINMISAEKKLAKSKIKEIIESAIKTAYKKDYGNKDENVEVNLNLEEWKLEISVEKTVVKEVKDPATEISFEDLWEDAEAFEEWDVVDIDVSDEVMWGDSWDAFGRIASQAARQVIIQKIWETEKEKIYDLFKDRQWEVISMKVEIIESGKVILDYNGNQVVLPKSEQVSRDNYKADQRLSIYVAEVKNTEKTGPKVVLSRKHPMLVWGLFANYVPEVEEWTISIDKVVRRAGFKTKVLVSSEYEEIDPVWTMVWQKWIRVKSVMEEIWWEKIDIINNSWYIEDMIKLSLSPAKIDKVLISDEENIADVYIDTDEKSKALGKWWANINLASELLWYRINIID